MNNFVYIIYRPINKFILVFMIYIILKFSKQARIKIKLKRNYRK